MCFLIATAQDSKYDLLLDRSRALYHEPLAPILKLEESVYQFIEDDIFHINTVDFPSVPNLDSLDLKIYFRPEAFEHVLDPYSDPFDYAYIYKHYKVALEKVALYGLRTSLDEFLFSATDYDTFFKNHCSDYTYPYRTDSTGIPCRRRENWVRLRKVYKDLVFNKLDLISRYGVEGAPEYDPCHYESLFHSMEYTEVSNMNEYVVYWHYMVYRINFNCTVYCILLKLLVCASMLLLRISFVHCSLFIHTYVYSTIFACLSKD